MTSATTTPTASTTAQPSGFGLIYPAIAPPIVWFAHFILIWMVNEMGCRANLLNLVYFTPDGQRLTLTVLTGVALLLIGYGALLAWRNLGRLRTDEYQDTTGEARTRFMMLFGLLSAALFAAVIVMTYIPTLFLPICDRAA